MAAGLGGFGQLLAQFRASSAWATAGLSALPFVTALADLSPPWPPGIVALTAVVQLVVLAVAYLSCRGWSRRATLAAMGVGIVIAVLAAGVYLQQLSAHTYQVPTTDERFAMGTQCTDDARAVFEQPCAALGLDALRSAEYEAERLWTRDSIDAVRLRLVALWSLAFAALAWTLGVFFTFQIQSEGGLAVVLGSIGHGRTATPRGTQGAPEPTAQTPARPILSPLFGDDQGAAAMPDAAPPPPVPSPPSSPTPAPPPPASPAPEQAHASAPPELPATAGAAPEDAASAGAEPAPEPPAPQAEDERWINARIEDMPDGGLRRDEVYTLAFAIEAQADSNLGESGSAPAQAPATGSEYMLTVQLYGEHVRIDEPMRQLRVRPNGLSAGKALFQVEPLRDGPCELVAMITKDGNFVQQLVLTLMVGEDAAAQPGAQRIGRTLANLEGLKPRDLGLLIRPAATGFTCTASGQVTGDFRMPIPATELAGALGDLRKALMRVVELQDAHGKHPFQDGVDITGEHGDAALRIMAEAGYALFRKLFRHHLADAQGTVVADWLVAQTRDRSGFRKVQINSMGCPVPWGLLYVAETFDPDALDWENFLGMRHVLDQIPVQPAMLVTTEVVDQARDGLSVSINLNRDIDREMHLDVVRQQEKYWAEAGAARQGLHVTTRATGADLLRALADPATDDELLYLYCHAVSHGLDEAGGPSGSSLRLDTATPLTLQQLELHADTNHKLRGQPLVFINACESAELSPLFYSSFIPYFMAKGARGVIGTECRMPALFAARWAQGFFDAVLDGAALGEAVLTLRRRFLATHGNPLGLLYGVHCSADAQLAPPASAPAPA